MIKYFINELKTNTGLVALLSALITSTFTIITVLWTQKKETELLKINKNLELERYRQEKIFEHKKEIYALLYENLVEVADLARYSETKELLIQLKEKYNELKKNYFKAQFYMSKELKQEFMS